jgi:hypothetical protein
VCGWAMGGRGAEEGGGGQGVVARLLDVGIAPSCVCTCAVARRYLATAITASRFGLGGDVATAPAMPLQCATRTLQHVPSPRAALMVTSTAIFAAQRHARENAVAVTVAAAEHAAASSKLDEALIRRLQSCVMQAVDDDVDGVDHEELEAMFTNVESTRAKLGLSPVVHAAPNVAALVPDNLIAAFHAAALDVGDVVEPALPKSGRTLVSAIPPPDEHVRFIYGLKAAHCSGAHGVGAREAALAGPVQLRGRKGPTPVRTGIARSIKTAKRLRVERLQAQLQASTDDNTLPPAEVGVAGAATTLLGEVSARSRAVELAHTSRRALSTSQWFEG